MQGHIKTNLKSSAPSFTSSETLVQDSSLDSSVTLVQGSLLVELYLFRRYSGIGAIWGNLAQKVNKK